MNMVPKLNTNSGLTSGVRKVQPPFCNYEFEGQVLSTEKKLFPFLPPSVSKTTPGQRAEARHTRNYLFISFGWSVQTKTKLYRPPPVVPRRINIDKRPVKNTLDWRGSCWTALGRRGIRTVYHDPN